MDMSWVDRIHLMLGRFHERPVVNNNAGAPTYGI